MIRKLAIAVDVNGVIGNAGKLLYYSQPDMAHFAQFTRGTVLICGRKSADEMLDLGLKPSASRPLLVITENGILEDCPPAHIYYAANLPSAVDMAYEIATKNGLLGYTITGGKTVYDEYLLKVCEYPLDAAYIATIQKSLFSPTSPDVVRLAGGHPGVRIQQMMRNPKASSYTIETTGRVSPSTLTRSPVTFAHVYDALEYDHEGVQVLPNGLLRIYGTNGVITIPLHAITGHVESRGSAHLEIHTSFHKFDVRLNSGYPGIAYLKHIIDQHLITKGSK